MADRRLVEFNIGRLRDRSPAVRLKSIAELRLLDDPTGWEAVEQLLQAETETEVKQAAREALAAHYLPSLTDPSVSVRLKTIQALRILGEASTMNALEHIYRTDTDPAVRQAAQQAGFDVYTASRKR